MTTKKRDEGTPAAEGSPLPLSRGFVGLAAALVGISALYLALRIPIGIPGEWITSYHTIFPDAGQIAALAAALGVFLAAAYLFDAKAAAAGTPLRAVLASVLTAGYMAVTFAVVACGPLSRAEFVVPAFEFNACGLFKREAMKIEDPQKYLADLPATLSEYAKDYKATVRVNNNPPGTTMLFYGAARLAEASPPLAGFAAGAVFGWGFNPPNTSYSASVIGAWFLLIGAGLAFIPAYLTTSRLAGRPSFFTAAVAMLAGSMLLFNPGNDTLQVTFFLWMVYFWLRARKGHGALWGAALGLTAAAAFFFTLATAVVVVVLFSWTLADCIIGRRVNFRREAAFWGASAAGLLLGIGVLYAALRYDTFSVLLACYRNHAAFYANFPRTYWKWVLYNPWEFALFTGMPLAAAAIWAAARKSPLAEATREGLMASSFEPRAAVIATLVVMALLNISGKNSSEIDRLWVFFMPLLTIPVCARLARERSGRASLVFLAVLQVTAIVLLRLYVDTWRSEGLMQDLGKYMGQ